MRNVVLLIESSRAYGRGLLRGIGQYQRAHASWSLYIRPQGLDDPPPAWLRRWRGDGILARVSDQRTAAAIRATGAPAVDLRGLLPNLGMPVMGVDNRVVGRLAAEHLLERGLRHFGFCGLPRGQHPHMDQRCDFFRERLQEAGHNCAVFAPRSARRRANWEDEQRLLTCWLGELPKPVGVMTCHDDRGQQVLDACRRAAIAVPDALAVVSVDDDELLCGLSTPSLTSIDVNPQRVGYEAAALLDRLMNGEPPPAQPVLVEPRGIVTRQSTDLLAIDDPHLANALRIIRRQACEGLRITDVLREVPLSRSVLERRFRTVLGRTPQAEVIRVRLERARQLLAETDLSLEAVARKSGFRDAKYLSDVFRVKVGTTPGQFRRQGRPGG